MCVCVCVCVCVWNLVSHLRAEHRLGVLKNRILRKIFHPERVEVQGDWRKLHNDVLYDLYCPLNIIMEIHCMKMR